jgi:hypothetical protein
MTSYANALSSPTERLGLSITGLTLIIVLGGLPQLAQAQSFIRGIGIEVRMQLLLLGTVLLLAAGRAAAQSPQFVPAYPLYCQGPLTTGSPSGGETTTPFTWAPTGAGIEVVVLNCCVTEAKEASWASSTSTILAKSASDRAGLKHLLCVGAEQGRVRNSGYVCDFSFFL